MSYARLHTAALNHSKSHIASFTSIRHITCPHRLTYTQQSSPKCKNIPTRQYSTRKMTSNSFLPGSILTWTRRMHSHEDYDENAERITVYFVDLKKEGKKYTVQARVGASVLETTREFHIDLEGACEASLACSTCHVYIPLEMHNYLPEPSEEEEDMLDMAYGLEETSRLGCQVRFTKEMDGVTITLPKATRNYYVDKA